MVLQTLHLQASHTHACTHHPASTHATSGLACHSHQPRHLSVFSLSLTHTHTHMLKESLSTVLWELERCPMYFCIYFWCPAPRSICSQSRKYAAVLCVWVYVCFLCVILSLIIKGSLISSHPMLGLICILCQELMASPDGSLGKSLKTADWLACVYSLQRFSSWLICCCLFCFPAVLVSAHFKPRIHLNILYDFALPEL